MKTCKHCGAILSRNETKLEDIVGQEHAKRALEVAIAGEHTIAFIGNGEAKALAEIATRHGLTTWAIATCPCGYFGFNDGRRECTCSLSQIARWQKRKAYQNALQAEIVIECPSPLPHQIEDWANRQRRETEATVLARVSQAGERPAATLDETGRSLMRVAITQLELGTARVNSILSIAQTIAALGHRERLETYHLAEAIQYRPRRRHV